MWALTDPTHNGAKLSANMTHSSISVRLPRVIGLNASSFGSQIPESEEAPSVRSRFLPPHSDLRDKLPAVHPGEWLYNNLQEDVSWINLLILVTEACPSGKFLHWCRRAIWARTWNLYEKGQSFTWSSRDKVWSMFWQHGEFKCNNANPTSVTLGCQECIRIDI